MTIKEPSRFLININDILRNVWGVKDKNGYAVFVPGLNPQEGEVSAHEAIFDPQGKLQEVRAYDWSSEDGYRQTTWPSKQDSIYNANAAKKYAPQVFSHFKKEGGQLNYAQIFK